MTEQRLEARRGQGGFALILAILSLLVLTFLGLTLAATTSTELQIATNYRWGQQATYNAEAGIEVAKIYLRAVPNDWATILPTARTVLWLPSGGGSQPTLPANYTQDPTPPFRDWENSLCDDYNGHTGYGLVLWLPPTVPNPPAGPPYLKNVSNVLGQPLNGSFTVWIRRALTQAPNGQIGDDDSDSMAILTSEGVAPGVGLRNAARRVIEMKVQGASFDCQAQTAMGGTGQGGAGFASCRSLGAGNCSQTGMLGARSTDSASMFATQAVGTLCDTGKD